MSTDAERLAAAFESAVRQAFIKVYGRPSDPTVGWRSILSSFLSKGQRLEWTKPKPLHVLILTEFGWIRDPFLSKVDFARWQKVSGLLIQQGWEEAGWDSINPAVQVVFATGRSKESPSMGASGERGNEFPVARIALDTRAFGPAYCPLCEGDIEDAFLMSDGKIVCVDCGAPVEELEGLSTYFHAAVPVTPDEKERYRRFSRQEP